jgi:hypothetical protein
MRRALPCLILSCCLLASRRPALADVELKFSGWISADIRYRVAGIPRELSEGPLTRETPVPSQWQLKNGWSRNENRVRATLGLNINQKVRGVADVEMVSYGFSDLRDLDSSTLRDRVDPYFFEFHAAYVDISNVVKGLDLRIGRQVVPWGAADKFNPVSNLNTLDLSDPLMFGRALANNMVRIDYSPIPDLSFTAVVIPTFRPAQLPRTAPLALLDPLRPPPLGDPALIEIIDQDRNLLLGLSRGRLRVEPAALLPEISFANTQVGLRAAYKLFEQDVAISYYRGRFGVPVPAWSVVAGTLDDPVVRAGVVYPRVDILGVEAAGSIEKLGGLGYWAEAAVNFPEQVETAFYDNALKPRPDIGPLIEIEYQPVPGGGYQRGYLSPEKPGRAPLRPYVVSKTPFVKATVGADYTLAGGKIYLNLQYVHGFIDEFGSGRAARPRAEPGAPIRFESKLGDYLVGGMDLKLLRDRLLLRLFAVLKLPSVDLETRLWDEYAPTGVIFPQIVWTVWDATELMVGSFIMLGDRSTKFGDPAAGGTEVFAKAKISF